MIAPNAFAVDKMDGDTWLKMFFHGKPGTMMMMPAPMAPMAPMAPVKTVAKASTDMFMWPWDMMKKPAMK